MIQKDTIKIKQNLSQQNNGMELLNHWKIQEKLLKVVLQYNIKNLNFKIQPVDKLKIYLM